MVPRPVGSVEAGHPASGPTRQLQEMDLRAGQARELDKARGARVLPLNSAASVDMVFVYAGEPDPSMPMVTLSDGGETGLAWEQPQLVVGDGVPIHIHIHIHIHIIMGGIPRGLSDDPEPPEGRPG